MAWKFWQKAPQDAKPLGPVRSESALPPIGPLEPVMPARDQVEEPSPSVTYCVITRVKVAGRTFEHHSVCETGVRELPVGLVTVTTGHWV